MGMDVMLYELKGQKEDGSLIVESPNIKWGSTRYTVRHKFRNEIEQIELTSGNYGDLFAIYRPKDFESAYNWAKNLSLADQEYIINILDILKSNKNLYLHYSI